MTRRNVVFHEDPGHGWLEVTIADLRALKVADQITPFSYKHQGVAYLEEDQDAGVFLKAAKAAGWDVTTLGPKYKDDTPIRGYAPYTP